MIDDDVCTECNHNDIRLVGGRDSREGRVEICVDGRWGTVCDDQWDRMEALVACRQMGLQVTGNNSIIIISSTKIVGSM